MIERTIFYSLFVMIIQIGIAAEALEDTSKFTSINLEDSKNNHGLSPEMQALLNNKDVMLAISNLNALMESESILSKEVADNLLKGARELLTTMRIANLDRTVERQEVTKKFFKIVSGHPKFEQHYQSLMDYSVEISNGQVSLSMAEQDSIQKLTRYLDQINRRK